MKTEDNYVFEFWWITTEVGKIANSLLINTHQFNFVPPDDMDMQVGNLITKLEEFRTKYRQQFNQTEFILVR